MCEPVRGAIVSGVVAVATDADMRVELQAPRHRRIAVNATTPDRAVTRGKVAGDEAKLSSRCHKMPVL